MRADLRGAAAHQRHEQTWKEEFKGEAAQVLLERLYLIAKERIDRSTSPPSSSAYYDPRPIYARYLPIVQSSGTGTSRLIQEISSEVFVVPLCLRAVQGGFPPPDQQITEFLMHTGAHRYPSQAMTMWAAFWIALCDLLRIRLTALGTTPAAWKAFFTNDMRYAGHNGDCIAFYDSVTSIAQKVSIKL